ncbi:hypothetical protein B0H14DRAFT_3481628 [Mycena olivaceomarginata]|nr:hypothetical protein B0H14DRAFT_3481628 [Mycena olivaceomarginata]
MSAISRPQQDDLMLSGYRASPALPDDRREALHWLYQSGVPVNVRSSTGPGRPVVYNPHPDLKPHILYKHKGPRCGPTSPPGAALGTTRPNKADTSRPSSTHHVAFPKRRPQRTHPTRPHSTAPRRQRHPPTAPHRLPIVPPRPVPTPPHVESLHPPPPPRLLTTPPPLSAHPTRPFTIPAHLRSPRPGVASSHAPPSRRDRAYDILSRPAILKPAIHASNPPVRSRAASAPCPSPRAPRCQSPSPTPPVPVPRAASLCPPRCQSPSPTQPASLPRLRPPPRFYRAPAIAAHPAHLCLPVAPIPLARRVSHRPRAFLPPPPAFPLPLPLRVHGHWICEERNVVLAIHSSPPCAAVAVEYDRGPSLNAFAACPSISARCAFSGWISPHRALPSARRPPSPPHPISPSTSSIGSTTNKTGTPAGRSCTRTRSNERMEGVEGGTARRPRLLPPGAWTRLNTSRPRIIPRRCPYTHSPPLNTDIAGIGVRVSFYIQSLCHIYLSGKADSKYTWMLTITSMAVTSLILSLRPEPDITFHDHRPLVAVVFVLKSCAVSAFTFLLWITAKTFGSMPACNSNAFIFLFVPIHVLKHGRIISLVLAGLGAFVFGLSIFEADTDSIQGLWAIQIIVWISLVVNTELLIYFNHFAPPDGQRSPRQFGQILPMFLTIISLWDVYKALKGEAAASPTPSRPPLPPVWTIEHFLLSSYAINTLSV